MIGAGTGMSLAHIVAVGIAGAVALFGSRLVQAADALTQHYNNARTGATLGETVLNTGNVNSASFGKLWTLYADGQVVAQPLYVSALTIDTTGNPNAPPCQGDVQRGHHRDHAQHRLRL